MLLRQNSPNTPYWQIGAVCVVLAGVIWFVFGQTLGYNFINFDDAEYVLNNAQVAGLTWHGVGSAFRHTVSANWHPLTMITHMLDCQFYGLRAGGHHASNVLLHTLAAILLFLVLRQMTARPDGTDNLWPSAFVAALFAIHPLRAESVAWISERKDVLSGVFFMLTLAAYLRYVRKPSLRSYLSVVFVFILGLLSKPMLVTMPFVLLLLDYWPLRRFAPEAGSVNRPLIPAKLIWEKIPLLLLSVMACGIALIAQRGAISSIVLLPLWLRIYNVFESYIDYIGNMFWPVKLALSYPYPAEILSGWKGLFDVALLCAVTYSAWAFRKKVPYLITGWLWYLGMLVPVIGLVQVGDQSRADRYTYLPQIGLYLIIAWGARDLSASWRYGRQILVVLATVIIFALAWCARIQTSYWKDSESIWRHSLAGNSNNEVARHNLGWVLVHEHRVDEGIFHLQEALKMWPDFGAAGQANPGNARVHEALGGAFYQKGRRDEAIFHWERALLLGPASSEIEDKLAAAYWEQGKIDPAIEHWEKALSIHPDDPHIHTSLGAAFLRKQRAAEAIDHYEKSLALAPRSIVTLNNLALLLSISPEAQFRNGQRAVQLAEQADELSDGKDPSVVRTLASAYAENGRFNDALDAARRALNLATAQKNAVLAGALKTDINLYELNFPRRESGR
jgi:tetratricopeptide (TPR) repeat protein